MAEGGLIFQRPKMFNMTDLVDDLHFSAFVPRGNGALAPAGFLMAAQAGKPCALLAGEHTEVAPIVPIPQGPLLKNTRKWGGVAQYYNVDMSTATTLAAGAETIVASAKVDATLGGGITAECKGTWASEEGVMTDVGPNNDTLDKFFKACVVQLSGTTNNGYNTCRFWGTAEYRNVTSLAEVATSSSPLSAGAVLDLGSLHLEFAFTRSDSVAQIAFLRGSSAPIAFPMGKVGGRWVVKVKLEPRVDAFSALDPVQSTESHKMSGSVRFPFVIYFKPILGTWSNRWTAPITYANPCDTLQSPDEYVADEVIGSGEVTINAAGGEAKSVAVGLTIPESRCGVLGIVPAIKWNDADGIFPTTAMGRLTNPTTGISTNRHSKILQQRIYMFYDIHASLDLTGASYVQG